LSPLSSPRVERAELADVLDENARLWKRVHALQERQHDMCAENVDLRRQLNTLRARSKAMAPLSLDTSLAPSPMGLHPSPLLATPLSATLKTPLSPLPELRKDVERLSDDNARLLSSAAEARTTIRQLRRQLERERERCSCSLRPERGHRRSSSNSSRLSAASPGEYERRSPTRRKWDWERHEGSPPDLVGGHMRTPSVRSVGE
jgi:predicted RNase H-like nuclease (RuvC/YqgF family)